MSKPRVGKSEAGTEKQRATSRTGVGRELAGPGDEGAAGELARGDLRERDGRDDGRVRESGLRGDDTAKKLANQQPARSWR